MTPDPHRCTFGVDSQYVDMAVEVFQLLGDGTRVRIILALRDGERSVRELAELVENSPTAVSQHLAKLRWAQVVRVRRHGNTHYYSLAEESVLRLVAEAVHQAEHALDTETAHERAGLSGPGSQ